MGDDIVKKVLPSLLVTLWACDMAFAGIASSCPPPGFDRAKLKALAANDWQLPAGTPRDQLAFGLSECLTDPDPELRDTLAFSGLQRWMRSGELGPAVMTTLAEQWQKRLRMDDPQGFSRPFAALALAEIARADRKRPFLSEKQREALLIAGVTYLPDVHDYRGFDDREGWRHGVAHGSDLLMQLSLNSAFSEVDLIKIRNAIATQVAPSSHFYVYGEPERLAAPIMYIAERGLISSSEWNGWFARLASPAPLSSWNQAFDNNAGLARLHNLRAFLSAIYVQARLDERSGQDVVAEPAAKLLAQLP